MILLIVVVLLILIYVIAVYNSLVVLKNRVEAAWKQVEVQLQRRHDLIPNLVNAVRGYMKYEQETLQKVVEARAKAVSAKDLGEKVKAEGELSGVLSRLLAVFERYPDLKANENVMRLQEELTTTENQLAFARQHYNDELMRYNNATQKFPGVLVARLFNFPRYHYFEVMSEEVKEVPEVKL